MLYNLRKIGLVSLSSLYETKHSYIKTITYKNHYRKVAHIQLLDYLMILHAIISDLSIIWKIVYSNSLANVKLSLILILTNRDHRPTVLLNLSFN